MIAPPAQREQISTCRDPYLKPGPDPASRLLRIETLKTDRVPSRAASVVVSTLELHFFEVYRLYPHDGPFAVWSPDRS